MNKKAISILAVMAISCAHAASISFQDTVNVNVPSTVNVQVQQFNPALGTLTGITLSIVNAQESATLGLENSGVEETWTINLGNGLVRFSDGTQQTTANLTYSQPHVVAENSITTINPSTPVGSSSQSYGSLASYIGTGYVSGMTVFFDGFWGANGMGGGDGFTVPSFTGTATWVITYEYVPEPASMGLILLGVAAIASRRRFRKQV